MYVDDGFSGTNFERPDFKRMLADLENHKANLVIVKDLSRFGREYAQMGMYIENDFEDWNIRFISIGENIDTLNGTDGILMPITNVINSQYAKECSRKTKQAHRALAKEGKFIGSKAPFGYVKDPNDRHHLIIDEEAAAIVQDIFRMFCDGIGYVRMTKILREQKILNPQAYFNKNNPDYYKSDYWRQAECVADSKEKYLALLSNHLNEKTEQDVKKYKSELKKADKRLAQLDKILNKLYEDRALEKITEERYLLINGNYENEYNELKTKQSDLKEQITQTETAEYNAKIFTDLIEKYINITELNARILNELIEKIVVHEKEIINGEKYQTVEIYYKFVGLL